MSAATAAFSDTGHFEARHDWLQSAERSTLLSKAS
jgi:hypothetical protein